MAGRPSSFLAVVALALGAGAGCGDAPAAPKCSVPITSCPADVPSYARDVAPIVAQRCAPCHAPGGMEASRPYQTYAQVKRDQISILFQVRACKMPLPDGGVPLTDDEKAALLGWLYCDAPDN